MSPERCHTGPTGVTLERMPTTRPRIVVTETDALTRALDDASTRWPEVTTRAGLLTKLAEEGHRAVQGRQGEARGARLKAIEATSGALTGLYGPGYLDELRAEWPE